jgi:hypothetical protein
VTPPTNHGKPHRAISRGSAPFCSDEPATFFFLICFFCCLNILRALSFDFNLNLSTTTSTTTTRAHLHSLNIIPKQAGTPEPRHTLRGFPAVTIISSRKRPISRPASSKFNPDCSNPPRI